MIKEFKTRTGCIFCDTRNNLEWLYVGDYGKENNIKANFLGLTKEINSVSHHEVNLKDKMVVTISTQKGCPMSCRFCDCPKVGFHGSASYEDLRFQVEHAIRASGCISTNRFNLHLARMGEPMVNAENVCNFVENCLRQEVWGLMDATVVHPVFTTMFPYIERVRAQRIIDRFCYIKNHAYNGEAGIQFSINSTDEKQRDWLFDSRSMSIASISKIASSMPAPIGRKYTLNFPVTADTVLDAKELARLFDKAKFIVKITPIHETTEANRNGIKTVGGYETYDVYRQFEEPLLEEGWDVIVFVPSKEEDEDRITCGNALLSGEKA